MRAPFRIQQRAAMPQAGAAAIPEGPAFLDVGSLFLKTIQNFDAHPVSSGVPAKPCSVYSWAFTRPRSVSQL